MKVFLSHISEEAPLAFVVKEWVEDTFLGQVEVFVSSDIKDLPSGKKWLDEIDSALQNAQVFLVLCSPASISRPWINFETGCAWIKDIPIMPLCHSGQSKGTLPPPISEFQALEVEDPLFVENFFKSIAKHLSVSKLPRIDKSAMNTEIKSSLGSIETARVSDSNVLAEAVTFAPQDELPSEAIDILKLIADLGDEGYEVEALAKEFNISKPKIEYYLDILGKDLLKKHASSLGGTYYYLTPEGRQFLVDHNLL